MFETATNLIVELFSQNHKPVTEGEDQVKDSLADAFDFASVEDARVLLLCDDHAFQYHAGPIPYMKELENFWGMLRFHGADYVKLSRSCQEGACRSLHAAAEPLEQIGFRIKYALHRSNDGRLNAVLMLGPNDSDFARITRLVCPARIIHCWPVPA